LPAHGLVDQFSELPIPLLVEHGLQAGRTSGGKDPRTTYRIV